MDLSLNTTVNMHAPKFSESNHPDNLARRKERHKYNKIGMMPYVPIDKFYEQKGLTAKNHMGVWREV